MANCTRHVAKFNLRCYEDAALQQCKARQRIDATQPPKMLWLDKINTHSTQPSLTLHLQLSHPFNFYAIISKAMQGCPFPSRANAKERKSKSETFPTSEQQDKGIYCIYEYLLASKCTSPHILIPLSEKQRIAECHRHMCTNCKERSPHTCTAATGPPYSARGRERPPQSSAPIANVIFYLKRSFFITDLLRASCAPVYP